MIIYLWPKENKEKMKWRSKICGEEMEKSLKEIQKYAIRFICLFVTLKNKGK